MPRMPRSGAKRPLPLLLLLLLTKSSFHAAARLRPLSFVRLQPRPCPNAHCLPLGPRSTATKHASALSGAAALATPSLEAASSEAASNGGSGGDSSAGPARELYDVRVVVVGGGHAGCEAAAAAGRLLLSQGGRGRRGGRGGRLP
eukprot:GHVU01130911.1.p1 GENE.GHVU01130911.1~~GHVU01130911.1.p1  ORF type:complete len:145 (-),score=21.26 GHVU01130911.1:402-836(-)